MKRANKAYDANGCLKTDTRRQITATTYGRANLPTAVTVGGKTVNYLYDANDQRVYKYRVSGETVENSEYYLRTAAGQDLGILDFRTQKLTWYIQGTQRVAHHEHQYTLPAELFNRMSGPTLPTCRGADVTPPAVAVSFGPIIVKPAFVFYNYDHLGNTRITYTCKVEPLIGTQTTKTYTAISLFDYDPYGKVLRNYGNEKYLTTYHERDVETGLDYRGARFYDGEIYRFLSLDPLQAKYPSVSSFSYVLGNPVVLVDPTGMSAETIDPKSESAVTAFETETKDWITRLENANDAGRGDVKLQKGRIEEMKEALKEIQAIRENTTIVFTLQEGKVENGRGITQASGDEQGNITQVTMTVENIKDMATVAHEMAHGGQIMKGEYSFTGGGTVGGGTADFGDEAKAYIREGAFTGNDSYEKWQTREQQTLMGLSPAYSNLPRMDIDNNTNVGAAHKADKTHFNAVFGGSPTKEQKKMSVGQFMQQQNKSSGSPKHLFVK